MSRIWALIWWSCNFAVNYEDCFWLIKLIFSINPFPWVNFYHNQIQLVQLVSHNEHDMLWYIFVWIGTVLHEGYKFPFTQMNNSLGNLLGKMHDNNLLVVRGHPLVGKKRVVDGVRLLKRLLWKVKSTTFHWAQSRSIDVEGEITSEITSVIFNYDGANYFLRINALCRHNECRHQKEEIATLTLICILTLLIQLKLDQILFIRF